MISDVEVRLAEWIIQQACEERRHCDGCPHFFNCGMDSLNDWEIPDPPPEPTERQRIEWLRMLPDDEMLLALDNIGFRSTSWWHEVVSLEKFRNYVGLI